MLRGPAASVKILETLAGLLIACALPCLAGPPPSDGRLPSRPDEVQVERLGAPERALPEAKLRLPRLCDMEPDRDSLVRQVTLTELPPGSLVIEYEGFQSFVVRKLQSRYRSLWRGQISLLYDETNMTDAEFRAAMEDMALSLADHKTGRWWDRSWRDSLLPEKGGAPARPWVHTVGEELELFRIGAVHLSNELKLRVDKVAVFSLEADPGLVYREREEISQPSRVARDHARLQRAMIDPEDDWAPRPTTDRSPVGRLPTVEPLVALELRPARTIFLEGVSWRFKVRPLLRLRLPDDMAPEGFVRTAAVRLGADMYLGQDERHVLSLDVGLSYRPETQDVEIRGELALVSW